MELPKYDVFISYSRKDYVDEQKNPVPDNVISIIKDTLDKSGISYWMDEEGNLTGKKFAHIIAGKIRESMVFLFVCSQNSVLSRWVDRELSVADTLDKHIIPFICDESYLDDKVIMFTSSLDRIEYQTNSQKELEKLINTIKKDKADLERKVQEEEERLLRKQKEEEEQRRRQAFEEKKKQIKIEIGEQVIAFKMHSVQQESILQQLYIKNQFLGKKVKQCPVCQSESTIDKQFCETCGWQFPMLYSLEGNDDSICNPDQLALSRANWQGIKRVVELQAKNKELEGRKYELEEMKRNYEKKICYLEKDLDDFSKQCSLLKISIDEKVRELASLEETVNSTSMQLEHYKQEVSNKEKQMESSEELIIKLQTEIKSLKQNIDKFKQEIKEKEKYSLQQITNYKLLEEKYNQLIKGNIATTLSEGVKKNTEATNNTATSHNSTVAQKEGKCLTSYDEAFLLIESCCDRSPIQENFDLNRAKLSLSRLKNALDKKYNLYVSKSAIIACKNIGELKLLLFNSSNKNKNL